MPVGAVLTGLALAAGVLAAVFTAAWLAALAAGRWNVVDTVWGLAFVLTAAAVFGWDGVGGPRGLAGLAAVAVWGLRLSAHIGRRSRGQGEDRRYAELVGRRGLGPAGVLGRVFIGQAAVAWVVSLPVQLLMAERGPLRPLGWAGAAVWAVGFAFEAVGDRQLDGFRADPANAGRVMDRGLWRYTRHPNYFGDACVWWGLFLMAAQHWPGALTVVSPLLMTWLLARGTGKPLMEGHLSSSRPGYADYVRRTSGFLPLPRRG